MNGRSFRLQTFLARFGELKAAAGNDPNVLRSFDQTTPEIWAAANRMNDYLAEFEVERELFHGADKLVAHAPEELEGEWNEFKRLWEAGLNYLAMCEIDPDWPRDYNEHLRRYVGSGVIPGVKEDEFIPEFHDGPAAIRLALDYLQDHDECRAGLDAIRYLVDTVRLDFAEVMERWQKVRPIFMPKHVAELQQRSYSGPLTELFDDAVRAYICGATAAAFAMCRALLETILKQCYLPGDFTRKNKLGKERDIPLGELLKLAGSRYEATINVAEIQLLVTIANAILHGKKLTALHAENHILQFFKILKALIQNAPAPR
jgi:hypothetical protein